MMRPTVDRELLLALRAVLISALCLIEDALGMTRSIQSRRVRRREEVA